MSFPDTRISLLHRIADKTDSVAWMDFCAIYEKAVYRIARKYGLQDADAREVSQVAEGMIPAHQQGIVHRDIKPANLLLDEDAF